MPPNSQEASPPDGPGRLMSTPVGSITNTSPMSESSEMCETPCQIALPGVSVSTRRVSRVNPSPLLGDAREPRTSGGSGLTSSEPFATYDPTGACWRTSLDFSQPNLDGSLGAFCGTWPRAATMRSGTVFQRSPLVPRTSGTGFGLWPTPVGQDDNKSPEAHMAMKARMPGGPRYKPTSLQVMVKGIEQRYWPSPCAGDATGSRGTKGKDRPDEGGLAKAVKVYPTPQASDWKGPDVARVENRTGNRHSGDDLPTQVGGQLNPMWVEWLMGFPLGWTALDASETPSSRRSQRGSCGE